MKIKFDITGMTCAACSARVEKVTSAIAGVNQVNVNLLAGTMQVEAENEMCRDQIIAAVINAGYGAAVQGTVEIKKQKDDHSERLKDMKIRIIGSAGCLIVIMYFLL